VEHTFLDPLYEGMPVVIVHDWEEINQVFLEEKYEELKDLRSEKIHFDYWNDLMRKTQQKIRTGDLFFTSLEATLFSQADMEDLQSIFAGEETVIYKGFLSSLHPFQMADLVSSLLLYDPWFDRKIFDQIDTYLQDRSLTKNKHKISVIDIPHILDYPQTKFSNLLNQMNRRYSIFLDFSYYRNSLVTDFTTDFKTFRNHLLRDLKDLYSQLPLFTLLCGNRAQDPYVKKVLGRFSQETGAEIEEKGTFWYCRKSFLKEKRDLALPCTSSGLTFSTSACALKGAHPLFLKGLQESHNYK
jgi:hypothetical protein